MVREIKFPKTLRDDVFVLLAGVVVERPYPLGKGLVGFEELIEKFLVLSGAFRKNLDKKKFGQLIKARDQRAITIGVTQALVQSCKLALELILRQNVFLSRWVRDCYGRFV